MYTQIYIYIPNSDSLLHQTPTLVSLSGVSLD